MTVASLAGACQAQVAAQGPQLLVSGTPGDRAPALLVPPGDAHRFWRPAETRAGELGRLLQAVAGPSPLAVASRGVEPQALAENLADIGSAATVVSPRTGAEQLPAWLARVRAQNPDARKLLELGPAPDAVEGRQAYIFGGCESLRARLGLAQEQGLTRLESFLDRIDQQLAAAWSEALSAQRKLLDSLAKEVDGPSSGTCSPATREHVSELLGCATSSGPCHWTPRVFLQGFARVGRVAEPPELGLDEGACGEALRELVRAADVAAIEILDRAAPRWSELAARVAALGLIDAAVEDTCAPRRRRVSPSSLASLHAQMAGIEAQLARGSSYPSVGPAWVASVPEGAGWTAAAASFHVPGQGEVQELARFEAGTQAASTQVRERARALGASIAGAGECAGRVGEAPLTWTVYDLDALEIVDAGEVFPETLVCGSLPFEP